MTRRALREARFLVNGPAPLPPTSGSDACHPSGKPNYAARAKAKLAVGRHPATGTRTRPDVGTCGECVHHVVSRYDKRYHKCEKHRLGTSSSEASDIRVSWPACDFFVRKTA